LILFAVIAEFSALDLFIAGIGPALITVACFSITTFYLAKKHDYPKGSDADLKEIVRSLARALPAIIAPAILVGGMLLGYFGPTEASAVTIGYAIIITIVVYRKGLQVPRYMWDAGLQTARTTSVILVIVAGAALFSWILTVERMPSLISNVLFSISENPVIILLMVNIFLLIVGMFLEPISALVMTIPLIVPTLLQAGYDPIHIGIIMVFNLMIGLLTPPMGLLLFLSSDLSGAPPEDIIVSLKPYYVTLIVALLVVSFVPSISLFLV
jgi:tripartite ATP-independent transporter DctM subunit